MRKFGKKAKLQGRDTVTLDEVVAGLTLDEKIALLSGKDFWHTVDIPDAQIPVPSVMVSDGPHGLRKQNDAADQLGVNDAIQAVCFPSAAGLAASFDKELLRQLGETLGEECQAENVAVLLGPAVNIKRSPLCGRNFEYMSEDPYAAGQLAAAYIEGVQSKNVGTSIKHFAANSQEKRRLMSSSEVDERALREIYLKGFETAIKTAKPWTVMCSYNKINGVYASENRRLLTEILRDEWGYKGVVVSDWGAVNDRAKGLKAGLDLEMPGSFGVGEKSIRAAIEKGALNDEDIDRAVRRLVNLAFKFTQNRIEAQFDREAHHMKAVDAAVQTAVLLKNDDQILPLDKSKRVVYIGEFAQHPRYQGGGSSHINSYRISDCYSRTRKFTDVFYEKGFGANDTEPDAGMIADAVRCAADSDVAVIFAGLPDAYETEGADRAHMRLPKCQNELIRKVAAVQKNVVVVLHNGSPVEMPWIDDVKAVLECYLGGEGVGEAQAKLLWGEANPSGKLSETFPVSLADTPSYLNFPGTYNTTEYRESVFVGYRYYATYGKPVLFPFGHGLSYTTFDYKGLTCDANSLSPNGAVTVAFELKNTGSAEGAEVAQLYVAPKDPRIFRPAIELRGFEKVRLAPGESKRVSFTLTPDAFSYYCVPEKAFVCDDGAYEIRIGASSADVRLTATVQLTGFGVHENGCSEQVRKAYEADAATVTRAEFSDLCGREITIDKPQKPFTRENCLADIAGTPAGDRLDRIARFVADRFTENMGSPEMIYSGAMEAPIRQLTAMSQGTVPQKLEDAIVDFMNGKKGAYSKIFTAGITAGINALKKK